MSTTPTTTTSFEFPTSFLLISRPAFVEADYGSGLHVRRRCRGFRSLHHHANPIGHSRGATDAGIVLRCAAGGTVPYPCAMPRQPATPPVRIRTATAADLPVILAFIRELAVYERLEHQVVATEALLQQHLFD